MGFLSSSVGRKVVMAITGFFMLFFVTVHLLGNSSIFFGPSALNTYAEKLHNLGPLVWIFRGFMFLMLAVHVYFGIMLTLENSAANPSKYAVRRKLKATFASRDHDLDGSPAHRVPRLPPPPVHVPNHTRHNTGRGN